MVHCYQSQNSRRPLPYPRNRRFRARLAVDANRTARCRVRATSTDTSNSGRSVTSTLPEYPSPGAARIAPNPATPEKVPLPNPCTP